MGFVNPFWKTSKGAIRTSPYAAGTSGNRKRSTSDIDWLYGKIAYASATAGDAGLSTKKWAKEFRAGKGAWYQKQQDVDHDGFTDPLYIPKAHITSVTITGDPATYGTVRTCKVAFKTYNKGQLNALKDFLTPGKEMSVTVGWDGRLNTSDVSTSFKGTVYKFNIQLNEDGGFECVSEGIGKGNNMITNVKVDAQVIVDKIPEFTDATGVALPDSNIFSVLQKIQQQSQNLAFGRTTFFNKYPGTVAQIPEDITNSDDPKGAKSKTNKKAFITLDSVMMLINEILKKYATDNKKFAWAPEIIYRQATVFPEILSANPKELLAGSSATCQYGSNNIAMINPSVKAGKVDAKEIYISVDWLIEKAKINYVDTNQEKQSYLKIGDYWTKIFDLIKQNLGDSLQLTLAHSADASDPNTIYIIDINAIDSGVTPLLVDSDGPGNWVRSVNLTSDLTSDIATAFYVDQQAPTYAKAGRGADFLTFLGLESKKTEAEPGPFKKAAEAVGKNPNDANVSALSAEIKKLVLNAQQTDSGPSSLLVPFQLSVVLEGSTGFEYGDAIRSSYVPDIYNIGNGGIKIGFFVTQVEHQVQDGDWTTTLSTQCKLYK